jgi:hypothetical protein
MYDETIFLTDEQKRNIQFNAQFRSIQGLSPIIDIDFIGVVDKAKARMILEGVGFVVYDFDQKKFSLYGKNKSARNAFDALYGSFITNWSVDKKTIFIQ